MGPKEYMSAPLEVQEVRDADDGITRVKGLVSIFDEKLDDRNEIVRPGAFKQTLKHTGGKVPIHKLHNPEHWMGHSVSGKEVKRGLDLEMEFLTGSVPVAASECALLKHSLKIGRPAGFSIGFRAVQERNDPDTDMRELLEIALFEVSTCPPGFHAAPNALVDEVRAQWLSLEPLELDSTNHDWADTEDCIYYNARCPDDFNDIRTIELQAKPPIRARYGADGANEWRLQALEFPLEEWTLPTAQAWLNDMKRNRDIWIPDSVIVDDKLALLLGLTCDLQGGKQLLDGAVCGREGAGVLDEAAIHSLHTRVTNLNALLKGSANPQQGVNA